MSTTLPIEQIKAPFLEAFQKNGGAIVSAPPGSGKTTALPLWLLEATTGPIFLLIPKRMAVKLAASQLARNLGEKVGQQVGYRLRNDQSISQATRLTVTSYGSFLQLLLNQPEQLEGATLIMDEFHERGLDQDLSYALINHYFEVFDDRIKRVIMSATLNVNKLIEQTGLPLIESDGFSYPIDIRYHKTDIQNARAVAKLIEQTAQANEHHLLVFCAGLREIRAIEQQLSSALPVLVLHGQLNNAPDIETLNAANQTIILSTNIAESSVTLPRVHTVIDLGTERFADVNPITHISELKTRRISQASAKQRAGRAGRLGPGVAIRLWSEDEQSSLVGHQPAELSYAEFTQTVLQCAVWGSNLEETPWLESPAKTRWTLAVEKLQQWGALDEQEQLTTHGRAMAKTGLAPWLAHLLVTAEQHQQLAPAAYLAACLSQNAFESYQPDADITTAKLPKPLQGEISNLLKRFNENLPARIQPLNVKVAAVALADRICRWQDGQRGQLVSGTALTSHKMQPKGWALLLDGLRQGNSIQAYALMPIDEAAVLAACPAVEKVIFNADSKSFIALRQLGNIQLERRSITPDEQQKQQAWQDYIETHGESAFELSPEQIKIKTRWHYAACHGDWPHWPTQQQWAEAASQFMAGIKHFNQLPFADIWQFTLGIEALKQLNHLYPNDWQAPTGRKVALAYDVANQKVVAELKLQECFGLTTAPCIGNQQPIELHLLAPNGRPVAQVTDLSYFWHSVYPEVRKELRGRYAKHPWPEDPISFRATAQTNRQLRQSS